MNWNYPTANGHGRQIGMLLQLNRVFHRWLQQQNALLVGYNGRFYLFVRDGLYGSQQLRDELAANGIEPQPWPQSEAAMVWLLEN